jgi:RNA polymerase primary sigma factor
MTKRKTKKADYYEGKNNSEENALFIYLQEINRIPLLSKEEEEKVAKLAAAGNAAAKERLINANLRFVVSVAKKYQGKGLSLEDLISEGNLGLLNAADYFDVEKGNRFITYAVWWIRQSIIKAIHEKGRMIRLPSNKVNELTKIDKTRQGIQSEHGSKNDQDVREIADYLEMTEKKVTDLMQICQDVISLDEQPSNTGNTSAIKDIIEDEQSKTPFEYAIDSILKTEMEAAVNSLEERAANIIRQRYGLGETMPKILKEIGSRYNLSRERVRQIEKRALGELRQSSYQKRLISYIS